MMRPVFPMAADLLEQTRRERDFYLRLLALDAQSEPEPFLKEALSLVVELTGAERGYLELRDEHDDAADAWSAENCSEDQLSSIRSQISRGIIAAALASGETVVTQSALLDERFNLRDSVQRAQIQGVLCAPIGGRAALGVVYLQKRGEPGSFCDADRRNAEIFAAHLAPIAERVFLRRRMAAQKDAMREIRARYRVEGIVGRSTALADAIRQAMHAAPTDVNVLLTGDSGTGKTQLARAIHANSPRAGGPFVEINCAAMTKDLIEKELFGSAGKAYTGAPDRDAPGKVAAAEHGTLFLDEIAEIPFESQSKLLQLLQSRTYFMVGGTTPISADVRLIAATNTDLDQAVRERRFREDLYYRLQVLPVRMPTLRERASDVPELAKTLLSTIRERHRFPSLDLSPAALRSLEAAEWPGNVRQLENAIEAAAIRASGAGVSRIEPHHLFPGRPATTDSCDDSKLSWQEQTRRFQRTVLERALEENDWNVTETAKRLDLARSHVHNLILAFGLKRR
jgi:Nif-specific regulatory protein